MASSAIVSIVCASSAPRMPRAVVASHARTEHNSSRVLSEWIAPDSSAQGPRPRSIFAIRCPLRPRDSPPSPVPPTCAAARR